MKPNPPVGFEVHRLVRALARGKFVQPPLFGCAKRTRAWRENHGYALRIPWEDTRIPGENRRRGAVPEVCEDGG